MGFLLFRAFLAINAFNIATENPIYKYRFKVYPVDTCPMNASEFESAARRRNCTGNSRYLCAPDRYLSNLIEFCTDRNRLFYEKGNCVRLEGTGDLNHYSCVDRFTSGCPTEPYQDDKIFEYPMCLAINRESKCFISEKKCPERSKEDDERNKGKPEDYVSSYSYVIFIFMIALASVVFGATLLILRKEIKKRTEIKRMKNNHLQMDEKYILLQDIPEEEANDKNVQEVDRNDEMQINENALREYLSKGELTIQHIRCIIVGCAGAGKTTLLSRLKNIPYEELKKIESTEIIDVHVNIFEVNKEEETIKCVDEMNKLPLIIIPSNVIKNDNKTEEEIVADESVQSKRESEEIVQEKKNSTEKSGTHGISSMERKEFEIYKRVEDMREKKKLLESYENNYSKEDAQDDKEIPNTPDKNSPTIEEESFLQLNKNTTLAHHVDENHAISKIMDALKQLSNEKDLRPRITFLDFAGQSLYYAFHQIYLSKKTCYILVVDMTKDLKKRVPDTDEQCASQFTSWTYEEYYKFWLKSIDSFSDTEAPVVVVGTHADKLSKDECNSFFQTFYDLVKNHFDLRRHLNRKRQFTIGFPESGSNLDELKDIKKCIASLLHDPEKIKPVWALFEHILEKEKIGKVISRKTVSNINEKISKEFRLTDRDITDMLLFLHRVGTLLYFDENQLKETIILDIQWFAQAFKSIVAYDVDVRKNDDKREHFLHSGEIDDDELNRIWMEKDSVYLSYKTEILSYMEQLGLLAACKTVKKSFYYVPSMNKRVFKDEGETMTKSSILCFQFDKHGQLPVYFFYSIVLKCLKIPEWSILQAKGGNCIYDKVACFSYNHLIVVMCLCKFQIQVQLRLPAEREIVQELREKVQNLVEEKIKECKKYVFQIGYKCENGIFNNEDEDSFVALEKFSVAEPLCNDCPFSKIHYLGKEICWVQRRKQTENREIIDSREADAKEKDMPFSRLENLNFARLSCIIFGPLTDVLRSVLEKEISPPSLSKRVNEYLATLQGTKRYVITNDQKTLISEGDYSKFDITLLYYLCRNVCAIPPHTNQWGNRPSPEDRSVSANIERIRLIRNEYAHTSHPSISNSDFERRYQNMLNIIQQLEKNLGTSTEFHDAVLEIKSKPMNQEESTKYIEKLDDLKVILDEGKLMERSIIPRNVKGRNQGLRPYFSSDNEWEKTYGYQLSSGSGSESDDSDLDLDEKKNDDNKKKSRKGGVNAKRVDNLGIGTVMILDERTIQPEKVQEKHVNIPVSYKPVEDLEKLMGLKSAVGMIYGYQQTGTAFRVGVDKIITAWHIVRAIRAVGELGDHAVFVDFNYEKDFQPDHLLRFPLKPDVLYHNEKLDIAVLQIKENLYGTTFPKPLENFVNFTRQIHEKYPIYLIGHTGAGKKSVDHVLKYWDPLSHRIKELYEWCEEEFGLKHGFGYTGIGDETLLHFQCMFRHGASGCPGFIVPPGGEAKVVTVLLRGFPDFYYFDNFTDEERERVPTEKLIQQGSNIDAIKKDMQIKNMDLYREIFHYREFISHSEKKKCIDTPSEEKVLNFPQNNEPINTEPVDSKDAVTLSPNACSEQNSRNSENMAILASGGNKTHPITNNFDPTQDINSGDEEKSTTNAAQPQTPPAIGHQTEDEKPQDQEKCSTDEESKAGTACNNAETTHAILSSETAPNSTVKNRDKNERV